MPRPHDEDPFESPFHPASASGAPGSAGLPTSPGSDPVTWPVGSDSLTRITPAPGGMSPGGPRSPLGPAPPPVDPLPSPPRPPNPAPVQRPKAPPAGRSGHPGEQPGLPNPRSAHRAVPRSRGSADQEYAYYDGTAEAGDAGRDRGDSASRRGARTGRRTARPRPSAGRVFAAWASTLMALAIVGVSGFLYGAVHGLLGSINRVNLGLGEDTSPGEAMNFLVVGSDSRQGLTDKQIREMHLGRDECDCTDTMMLVHISKDQDKVTVVSFPRDTWVRYPVRTQNGEQRAAREGKLNAAYEYGGPELLVRTIEQETGLKIDHYLEVNFLAFVNTVDALGGIEICLEKPFRDRRYTGLDLPPGVHRLNGVQALKYVRARHVAGTDGSDLGRTKRQQEFIGAMIRKASSSETLRSPTRIKNVLSSVVKSIKADENLSPQDLMTLALNMRNLSPANATFVSLPIENPDYRPPSAPTVSAVKWDEEAARQIFENIKNDQPVTAPPKSTGTVQKVTVPPSKVKVRVYNAAGTPGLAARVSSDLEEAGFAVAGPGKNWETGPFEQTVIRYDSQYTESIKTVQAALPNAKVEAVPGLGPVLQVVVGRDYSGVTPVRVGSAPAPQQSAKKVEAKTAADAKICKKG
ncbi:LytR family transcriptional regulator [Carbonactinospora thermoautotrophica]|nr:LytR family transcriptional regulator [Carbonactinospora thermoautotrophica]